MLHNQASIGSAARVDYDILTCDSVGFQEGPVKNHLKIGITLLAPIVVLLLFFSWGMASAEDVKPPHPTTYAAPEAGLIQVQASNTITNFRAMASRTRGRIDLSWNYTGRSFSGYFVVERSSYGSSWRSVSACALNYTAGKAAYSCADTGLTSGTSYTYRACIASKGLACSASSATRPVTVRAP